MALVHRDEDFGCVWTFQNSDSRAGEMYPCLPLHSEVGAERKNSTSNLLSLNANFSNWLLQIMSSSVLLKNISFTFPETGHISQSIIQCFNPLVWSLFCYNKKRSSNSGADIRKLLLDWAYRNIIPIWRWSSSGVKNPGWFWSKSRCIYCWEELVPWTLRI